MRDVKIPERLFRLHELMRHGVSVKDFRAQGFEDAGNSAFAAGDAAGQANNFHTKSPSQIAFDKIAKFLPPTLPLPLTRPRKVSTGDFAPLRGRQKMENALRELERISGRKRNFIRNPLRNRPWVPLEFFFRHACKPIFATYFASAQFFPTFTSTTSGTDNSAACSIASLRISVTFGISSFTTSSTSSS